MKLNPSPRRSSPHQLPDGLILERFLPYRLSVLMLRISNAIARSYDRRFRLSVPEWRVMAVLRPVGPPSAHGVAGKTPMGKGGGRPAGGRPLAGRRRGAPPWPRRRAPAGRAR